jgi:hypothetical protein
MATPEPSRCRGTPYGGRLDVGGWLNDPRWEQATIYERPFELIERDRDVARRLVDALD